MNFRTPLSGILAAASLLGIAAAEDKAPITLWTAPEPFPAADQIELIDPSLVRYQQIHTAEKPMTFAIGAAVTHFNDTWRASWAANPDGVVENQGTEFVRETISTDKAQTWTPRPSLAPQTEGETFHSHGSYLDHKGTLYFFAKLGPFNGPTKAFKLEAGGTAWTDLGIVTKDKATFWPMDEPQQMENGQWIMGGLGGKTGKFPAVAIANDDNLLQWEVILLPKGEGFKGFGETTVITKGNELLAISRNGSMRAPMVSTSTDAGKTWQGPKVANISMIPAKPYAGRLSDGRPYLIHNVPPVKSKSGRSRLCLLVGQPDGMTFNRVWLLRPNDPPAARFSGRDHNPQWAYPYAHEHDGALHIVHHNAKEDVELIVVPLKALKN
ncbi:MAG: exo-alpha-sialidase [Verrucomicrobiales bacterium]|nr:exo-alpha-sialidase [Verrucomicrobiales bacterium]